MALFRESLNLHDTTGQGRRYRALQHIYPPSRAGRCVPVRSLSMSNTYQRQSSRPRCL